MTNEDTLDAVAALLEVAASSHPQLLELQLDTILRSPLRPAVFDLASAFNVSHHQVGHAVHRACVDLDRLERWRGTWRDPAKVLSSPNLAALLHICHARLNRVQKLARQRRLEMILRKVERAYELARSRAWIEAFIGEPLPAKRHESQDVEP